MNHMIIHTYTMEISVEVSEIKKTKPNQTLNKQKQQNQTKNLKLEQPDDPAITLLAAPKGHLSFIIEFLAHLCLFIYYSQ